jgi:acyl-CoA synthetase (AMP-forming)/AMP-acid ligase II
MLGMMSDRPLLISAILAHAAAWHADTEIVSRGADGAMHRYTYAEAERRSKRLAQVLLRLGINPGDRVGTLAWNHYRHFELYYAVSGIGAVCHTINPRLFDDQIVYIVNHAADRLLFVDPMFLPLLERLRPRLSPAPRVIPLDDDYESLLAAENADYQWPTFDERTASSLCYTSGTTGRPKGVLYSHRSTVLHALAASAADTMGISARDTMALIVPMFHVHGWAAPYAAPMWGAKLVLPGPRLDGASLHELFEAEGVTLSAGVPTVWLAFEAHLAATGACCSTLKRLLCGGAAVPPSLIEAFERRGIEMVQGWGMTEMSPLGSLAMPKGGRSDPAALRAIRTKQGRPPFGVEMAIVDGAGRRLPHDGKAMGELVVRGPWIASGYYEDAEATAAAVEPDGWFHTGDVATIDPDGFMQITDRAKDVIKSGGEWISSIDLENAAMAHPAVAEAAVIAVPDPRWSERPLLVVTLRPGAAVEPAALIALLGEQFPRWMLPDAVEILAELPHTATGKVMKTQLRERFRDYRLPSSPPGATV